MNVARIIEWLKTKPADASYNYLDNGNCLLAQYLKETGQAIDPYVNAAYWFESGDPSIAGPISIEINYAAVGRFGDMSAPSTRWTYGEALKRFEELQINLDREALII